VTLSDPIWLLFALPLAAHWLRAGGARSVRVLRLIVYALVVLALAGPSVVTTTTGGTLIVVADRSASMPTDAAARQEEIIEIIERGRGADDRLGVVSFGGQAVIDAAPGGLPFGGFDALVDQSASRLGDALTRALALIGDDRHGRILVLSDGRATDTSSRQRAEEAAARSIPIDTRTLTRGRAPDLAIARVEAPAAVEPGELFLINAWVHSPGETEAVYELRRGGEIVSTGATPLTPGLNRLLFRDVAGGENGPAYTLSVRAQEDDAFPENNHARFLVSARESSPLLLLTRTPGGALGGVLRASGIDVHAIDPREADLSLAGLSPYSGVIIENIAVQDLGLAASATLATMVEERGVGLLMTGGKRSFAAGGYLGTDIERVLPVSIEIRNELRKLRTAIVVTMDRSGSMGAATAGGYTKMQLAGHAAASVAEMLSPIDTFGAIAVDSQPDIITPLIPADQVDLGRLRGLRAGGGGIYVYTALVAAANMIQDSDAGARHIILFADAADAEEPGDSMALLARCREAGITVSVMGLGSENDVDARLLTDIGMAGGGRVFFTNDPNLLPQLFTQDALAVSRSGFLDEPSALLPSGELATILDPWPESLPAVGGFNPTGLRPGASLGAAVDDEFRSPALAWWNVGLGRAAAHTPEADGANTGAFAQWDSVGGYWAGLARWLLGERSALGEDVWATQRVEGGASRVDVYFEPGASMPTDASVRVLRARPGQSPRSERVPLRLTAPDRLSAEIPLRGDEVLAPTVDLGDGRTEALAPVRLAYAAEFAPESAGSGTVLLRDIARRSGGRERLDVSGIWDELPPSVRAMRLAPWLFLAAAMALLVEVAERRLRLVSALPLPRLPERQAPAPAPTPMPEPEAASVPAQKPRKIKAPSETTRAPAPSNATLDSLRGLKDD